MPCYTDYEPFTNVAPLSSPERSPRELEFHGLIPQVFLLLIPFGELLK
jgi:hypothetical protein